MSKLIWYISFIIIIIMTTTITSTNNKDCFNNKDFQHDDHILCLFSYFCAYLFSGWRSYISVSFHVNQTAINAATRDCWTLIIQNMFGDICNENSICKDKGNILSCDEWYTHKKILMCLQFTSKLTFMANIEEDIFVDQSLLTAYFMQTNILHLSWHLIGQTTLGQR